MNNLPPSVDVSNAVKLYIPEFFEREEEHFDLVVVTYDGELLEIQNRNIISTCKICNKVKGNVAVKICYTYYPKIKYYLVHANGMLFAVKKMEPYNLQVSRILDNVEYFSVEDRDNSGIPQIVVFNINKLVSIHTLFDLLIKSDNNTSKIIAPAVLKLYSHIHAIRLQIKKVEQLLIEKKSLISRMSAGYMFITIENITFDCDEELVTVFGKKCKETSKIRHFPFSFGKPWIKVCFDFWVIGFFVSNLQNR
ncbi:unnamed protein product [Nezara viridula]|uniref:Uncharacterized protein n=1 Tax=Nezara viridula TaxID=85310 RepID=A0A9P0E542_NEZVI|nr:unnamed protein product [Nezara viridula]